MVPQRIFTATTPRPFVNRHQNRVWKKNKFFIWSCFNIYGGDYIATGNITICINSPSVSFFHLQGRQRSNSSNYYKDFAVVVVFFLCGKKNAERQTNNKERTQVDYLVLIIWYIHSPGTCIMPRIFQIIFVFGQKSLYNSSPQPNLGPSRPSAFFFLNK